MKKRYIIGNWKSYKTTQEAKDWFDQIAQRKDVLTDEEKEIVICVPYTLLELSKSLMQQYSLSMHLGSQNISQFDEGKYTGEVNGKQLQELVTHVIIGHSERRQNFGETNEIVAEKIQKAFAYNLTPIVCVSEIEQVHSIPQVPDGRKMIIAYEPLFAIGSGTPDTPENAEKVCSEIQNILPDTGVIYGGSVTGENVNSFTIMNSISGVLPGGASLDPSSFVQIIQNA